MKRKNLIIFRKWFSDYCKSFYSSDNEDQKNISLKENHTYRVCENIVEISRRLSLDNNQIMLAETIALFHDIGRFPQYTKYKTFRDSVSTNHSLLGIQTLVKCNILNSLPDNEKNLIIKAVKFHNAFSIPEKEDSSTVFFIKLIRDADKLDIWRVFIEFYESPAVNRASAVGLGLPDSEEYSEEILSHFYKKKIISLSQAKTLNDFKLLQLSWLFDVNFKPSFQLFSERDYLSRIIALLPRTEEIQNMSLFLDKFIKQKLQNH